MVGWFLGARPNIEVVRTFVRSEWALKGQVDIAALAKRFLSFGFSCEEDKHAILYNGP